jgi:uncharacterized membrane protein YhiD involved in acid resistance
LWPPRHWVTTAAWRAIRLASEPPFSSRSPPAWRWSQANWLINTVGKQSLGILTGVGFIGGGAILKRADSISGLTTAAALWFVTVIGLCFGGGQLWLGGGGAVLGYRILHGLDRVERRLKRERPVELNLKWRQDAFDAGAALAAVRAAGVQLAIS